ncbi:MULTISPECIES: AAA family ATPase [unclassified Pedobacter]|uniref:AAA family ATPase n=2 Tax=Pedobacter TaxID=84567 RepID=UPI001DA5C76D|nr:MULTISPECIES: AAA family ATPase [unclassified Pedobacter]CAH0235088.1 DNA replication and repair protein RecF [Pedobacter sp. Bi36]CAH0261689.1 DNA replication and repair protein RecF [Pedobacter sp. Bi126]
MEFNGYLLSLRLKQEHLPNGYPFNIPCLKSFEKLDFHPNVTFFTGENGVGKSTLIEAIAVYLGFNAEGGGKNFNFKSTATHSALHNYLAITKSFKQIKDGFFLRGESFYNVASEIDKLDEDDPDIPISLTKIIDSYGGISLHEQSHGESFWSLFMNRFSGHGVYILDEPESALSATKQIAMLSKINSLVNKNAQFIIATHSPILLSYPNAWIYEMSENKIAKVKYEESEVYRVYKAFLDHPQRILDNLFTSNT